MAKPTKRWPASIWSMPESRQMSFSAMGVGVEFNEKLLMRISQDSSGKYHFIGDSAEIPAIFEDELTGLRAVASRNGRIDVALSQGVQIREGVPRQPGDLRAGRAVVGRRSQGQPIGSATSKPACRLRCCSPWCCRRASPARCASRRPASITRFPASAEQSVSARRDRRIHARSALTSKANGRVMNLVDQVSIAKLQTKAEEELEAGNVDRATRLLATRFRARSGWATSRRPRR